MKTLEGCDNLIGGRQPKGREIYKTRHFKCHTFLQYSFMMRENRQKRENIHKARYLYTWGISAPIFNFAEIDN